jgi:uncharacterized protein YndB with AHSA1/START domain
MSDTIERSQTHATFVIERSYAAPVDAVWHALSDNDARAQWFSGGPEFDEHERTHDFRIDGKGIETGKWHNGPTTRFVSTYTDIVDKERMVYTYDMWLDDRHISTSLTTITLERDGTGTLMTFTEQAVHLDGLDTVEGREEGTRGLLDALGAYVTGDGNR